MSKFSNEKNTKFRNLDFMMNSITEHNEKMS